METVDKKKKEIESALLKQKSTMKKKSEAVKLLKSLGYLNKEGKIKRQFR